MYGTPHGCTLPHLSVSILGISSLPSVPLNGDIIKHLAPCIHALGNICPRRRVGVRAWVRIFTLLHRHILCQNLHPRSIMFGQNLGSEKSSYGVKIPDHLVMCWTQISHLSKTKPVLPSPSYPHPPHPLLTGALKDKTLETLQLF